MMLVLDGVQASENAPSGGHQLAMGNIERSKHIIVEAREWVNHAELKRIVIKTSPTFSGPISFNRGFRHNGDDVRIEQHRGFRKFLGGHVSENVLRRSQKFGDSLVCRMRRVASGV